MPRKPVTWDGTDFQGQPFRFDSGLTWDGFVSAPDTKMPQLRVLLGFGDLADHEVVELADNVRLNLYTHSYWTGLAGATPPNPPPLTAPTLQTATEEFSDAISAADTGGPMATAAKDLKREALIGLLRQLALYVQQNHGNVLENLLASGFDAVSLNRAQTVLETPVIRKIDQEVSGQLILRLAKAITNALCYRARHAEIVNGVPGPWVDDGIFRNSRRMIIPNLTRGKEYTFQVAAVGGLNGLSDWGTGGPEICK